MLGLAIAAIVIAGIAGYAACFFWPPEALKRRVRRNWS